MVNVVTSNVSQERRFLDRYIDVYQKLTEARELAKDDLVVLDQDSKSNGLEPKRLRKLAKKIADKTVEKYIAEHSTLLATAHDCQYELKL